MKSPPGPQSEGGLKMLLLGGWGELTEPLPPPQGALACFARLLLYKGGPKCDSVPWAPKFLGTPLGIRFDHVLRASPHATSPPPKPLTQSHSIPFQLERSSITYPFQLNQLISGSRNHGRGSPVFPPQSAHSPNSSSLRRLILMRPKFLFHYLFFHLVYLNFSLLHDHFLPIYLLPTFLRLFLSMLLSHLVSG